MGYRCKRVASVRISKRLIKLLKSASSYQREELAVVVLHEDDEMSVLANNGFVWIVYPDGREHVCDDDEADEWWVEYHINNESTGVST